MQLKASLKTKIEPAYLVYGTDYFLLHKSVQLLTTALGDAEVTKFDTTTTADIVVSALTTTSFFTTKRLVVYSLEEKTNYSLLNQYLREPITDSVLVLLQFGEKPLGNLRGVTLVNCNPMPENVLIPLIAKQIAPHQITQEAANYLVAATSGYYTLIDNELTKLLAFYQDLPVWELKHLQPYLSKTLDYQVYELGAAILQHNVAVASQILQYLLHGNNNEYAVFGGVVAQLRRAYYATNTQGDINTIGKILGCSPYAVKYSRRDYGQNPAAVKSYYARILELEYQIKAGQITAVNALLSLIYR